MHLARASLAVAALLAATTTAPATPLVLTSASPAGLLGHPGTIQVRPGETSPSQIFDQSGLPLQSGVARGAPADRLLHPKIDLGSRQPLPVTQNGAEAPATTNGTAAPAAPRDPEILGFAQTGEVTSGDWRSDFQLNDLSTIAYDSLNLNANGTVIQDAGYQGWWSAQMTNLIDAAHSAGDRVVLTVTDFSSASIESIVGTQSNRQTAITNIVEQLQSRGGDGVNVDFEGDTPTVVPGDYTTFIAELQYALRTLVSSQSYLTIDTYASAADGGTMMDIGALRPYVDAFDVMDYDVDYGSTLPNDPLNRVPYTPYSDTQVVNSYLALVPGYQILLGIPYYGYVYSTEGSGFNAPRGGDMDVSAVTYSGILADFGCTAGPPDNLQQSWDSASSTPWAAWNSPASGDPCGGNHGSDRELYYDNAQSLGDKYQLVNQDSLRGIGIWALGYDSGSSNLWNAITANFSVSHLPDPGLPAPGPGTPVGLGGGPLGGSPQAVSWGTNFDDVFWRGTDGGLWHMWEIDGRWYGPANLSGPGVMASDPSVVSSAPGNIDVFWEGAHGGLWYAYYGGGTWHTAHDLGMGPLGSAPKAVTWGAGEVDVFWAGDGSPTLWHAYAISGAWYGPVQMPGVSNVYGTPYPVSWGAGNEEVFWKGTDNNLWQDYYVNGWIGAESLGDGPLGSDPQPISFGQGLLDVFWKGTDGGVWHAYYDTAWYGPVALGASNVSSLPAPVSPVAGYIDVFWEDTSANLDHAFYAGAWYGPFTVGDGPMGSGPSVVSWGNGHMDIFWKGTDGNLWSASFAS